MNHSISINRISLYFFSSAWHCTACGHEVTSALAFTLLDRLQNDLDASKYEDSLIKFKDFLRANAGMILHPNHGLVVSCKEALFYLMSTSESGSQGISIDDKLECVELGRDILRVADVLEPGMSKTRGKPKLKQL